VLEGIVELRPERQLCVIPDAPNRGRFAGREIRIELLRSVDDAYYPTPRRQPTVIT
jgi:hypothetical protein